MPDPLYDGDPARIGPYTLRARLGGGGMGRVFLGTSPGGYPVAVKVVRPELAEDAGFRRRFAAEVAAARKVGGLYTAPVVDAATDADPPWMATAYIPGPSLDRAVHEQGPLPPEAVAALGAGLAEGLSAVHAQGVVHRDLKPGNVLLAEDGPRLIDFGIARALDSTSHTHSSAVLGTAAFMSPEQARAQEVGPASDVFSLGCVLAFAATGASPFGDGPVHAVVFRIVYEEPDLSALPGPLAALVADCLAKDPAARPGLDRVLSALAPRAPDAGPRAAGRWPDGDLTEAITRHRTRLVTVARTRADPDGSAEDALLALIALPEDRVRMFVLLGSAPGPDISTGAAAALAGFPADELSRAEEVLRDLAAAHLLTERTGGRWSMDPAFADRARTLALRPGTDAEEGEGDARERALDRLLDFYTTRAYAADAHVRATDGGAPAEVFADREAAVAWLDAERENMAAAVRTAHDTGRASTAVDLSGALAAYLYVQERFEEAVTVYTLAREAAHRADDGHGEAWACNSLGMTLGEVRRFDEAVDAYTRARDLYRQLDDTYNEGRACLRLGSALREVRRFEEAVDACTRACDLCRRSGDTDGEAVAWNNLGKALRGVFRFDEAVDAHTRARDLYQQLGDTYNEAVAWNDLGLALYDAHRFDEAGGAHTRARDLYRWIGDTVGEADGWDFLGSALRMVRRFGEAVEAHTRARDLCERLGDTRGEARAWNNLGNVLQDTFAAGEAVDAHTRARDLYQGLGNTQGEALAWNNLGSSLREARRFKESIDAHTRARDLYRQVGDEAGEALAWTNLGSSLDEMYRFKEAIDAHTQARELSERLGDGRGEILAWNRLGLALREARRFDEALDAHTRARELSERLGDTKQEADARNNLGNVLFSMRRLPEAADAYTGARDLYQRLGHTHGEALAWNNLGLVLRRSDRLDEAEDAYTRARDLSRRSGDIHSEAQAWEGLGDTWRVTRRRDEARHAYAQAVRGYQATGDARRLRGLKLFLFLRGPR
ncbi:tetratricopeptide repeat protein [Nocardiopsis sp. NPDC057823]|uniref:serine/threonine-protein kinase n=1 Tax=Nocardiopsis sp. NPDC057823 TaxID=3346256 RepID=UPI00366DD0D6